MNVWIVLGDYAYYASEIVGVFDTEEKANKAKESHDKQRGEYEMYSIHKWTVK